MAFTKAQRERIQQWLDGKFKCQKCREKKLYSVDLVAMPRAGTKGKSLVVIAVACGNCGFIEFYDRKSPALSDMLT